MTKTILLNTLDDLFKSLIEKLCNNKIFKLKELLLEITDIVIKYSHHLIAEINFKFPTVCFAQLTLNYLIFEIIFSISN